MSAITKQLPKRSEAKITKSLTPEAIRITEEFGWDYFKAGVLIVDEWLGVCQRQFDASVKYLLVREAKVKEKQPDGSKKWVSSPNGKWNIPCGRLQQWETFEGGAYREGREETGYDFRIRQLCHIGHRFDIDNPYVIFIYSAEPCCKLEEPDPEEIAEVKWFSYPDVIKLEKEGMLRNPDLTLSAIEQHRKHAVVSENLLVTYTSKFAQDM